MASNNNYIHLFQYKFGNKSFDVIERSKYIFFYLRMYRGRRLYHNCFLNGFDFSEVSEKIANNYNFRVQGYYNGNSMYMIQSRTKYKPTYSYLTHFDQNLRVVMRIDDKELENLEKILITFVIAMKRMFDETEIEEIMLTEAFLTLSKMNWQTFATVLS